MIKHEILSLNDQINESNQALEEMRLERSQLSAEAEQFRRRLKQSNDDFHIVWFRPSAFLTYLPYM